MDCVRVVRYLLYLSQCSGLNTTRPSASYGQLNVSSSTSVPGYRDTTTVWVDSDDVFWIFGGEGLSSTTFGILSDLWSFNGNFTWVKGPKVPGDLGNPGNTGVRASTNQPQCREGARAVRDSKGRAWLFGGRPSSSDTCTTNASSEISQFQ